MDVSISQVDKFGVLATMDAQHGFYMTFFPALVTPNGSFKTTIQTHIFFF